MLTKVNSRTFKASRNIKLSQTFPKTLRIVSTIPIPQNQHVETTEKVKMVKSIKGKIL